MSTRDVPSSGVVEKAPLRALFRITLTQETTCPMLVAGNRGTHINRNEVCENGTCASGCKCRLEVTVLDGERRTKKFLEGPIDDDCICPVFRQHDCVADIESFRDGEILVRVTVPGRQVLQRLIETVRQRGATVELDRVLPLSKDDTHTTTIEIDTQTITRKERETVRLAFEAGYYERPRQTNLSELANELGITDSAVSQRLNNAESKLIHELTAVE